MADGGGYSLADLKAALIAADKAGDTAGAQKIADAIRQMQAAGSASAMPAATEAPQEDLKTRGVVLPFGRDQDGNFVLALPEFIAGPLDTIMGIQDGRITADNITGKQILDLGSLFAGSVPKSQVKIPMRAPPSVSPAAEAARNIGVELPRGVSQNGPITRSAVNITGSVPFGGTPLRNAAKKALDQLGIAYQETKAGMGSGDAVSAADVIKANVLKFAEGADSTLGRRYTAKYDAVDNLVDPNVTTELPSTLEVANRIDRGRRSAGVPVESKAVNLVLDGATRPEGMSYKDAKFLREFLGEMLGNPQLLASEGISKGEAKALYASLTKDLEKNIQAAGGQSAVNQWRLATAEFERTSALREKLQTIVGPQGTAPEGSVFQRIMNMAGEKGGADIRGLARVRQAVGKQDWGEVASAIVSRLGDGAEGFDPTKFAKGWASLSDKAKQIIFETGPEGAKWRQALDDIATVSTQGKELKRVSEPSVGGVIKGALGLGGISGVVGLLTPISSIPAGLAGIAGARIISNMLAKPEGAAALATFANAYKRLITDPSVNSAGGMRAAAQAVARFIAIDRGLTEYQQGNLFNFLANEPARLERERRKKLPVTNTKNQT